VISMKLAAATAAGILTISSTAMDPIRDAQWHLEFLSVAEAHAISEGERVIVAVIDTGVDEDHPDLEHTVLPGIDFTTNSDRTLGRFDSDGHGTGVAGVIASHGRSLGVAPKSAILPVRDTTSRFGFSSHIADGILWASNHSAKVICIAAGGMGSSDLQAAVETALAKDIVIVAAAGNHPIASRVQYPAAYSGVVAVAGIDRRGIQARISVEGPEIVLAAPAVDIVTTSIRGPGRTGYVAATGTSAATAIIAGAAALVRARYPDLSAAEVVHRLTATADDKGLRGRDNEYGYGVVNLVRALTADVPPLPTTRPPTSPTTAAPPTGTPVDIPWFLVFSGLSLIAALVVSIVAYARGRRVS
jgi:type VII secretion-associated serine protease mycosin